MANLQNILGTMLATGMGGRSRRGPTFAAGNTSAGGFRSAAGLASLGYLAYKAWQERQHNLGPSSGQTPAGTASGGGIFGSGGLGSIGETIFGGGAASGAGSNPSSPVPPPSSRPGGGPTLGERLAASLKPHEQPEAQAAAETMGDQKALLLIRAMIAAANADGQITAVERQRILGKLDEAGADVRTGESLSRNFSSPALSTRCSATSRTPKRPSRYILRRRWRSTRDRLRRSHTSSTLPLASTCRKTAFRK